MMVEDQSIRCVKIRRRVENVRGSRQGFGKKYTSMVLEANYKTRNRGININRSKPLTKFSAK